MGKMCYGDRYNANKRHHLAILLVNRKINGEVGQMLYRDRSYKGVIGCNGLRLLPCWIYPSECFVCDGMSDYHKDFHQCQPVYGGPIWDYFRLNFDFGRFGSLSFDLHLCLDRLPHKSVGEIICRDRRYERHLRKLAKILSRTTSAPTLRLEVKIIHYMSDWETPIKRAHSTLRKLGLGMLQNVENNCSRVGMIMTPLKHFVTEKTFTVKFYNGKNQDFQDYKSGMELRLHALYGHTDVESYGPDPKIVYDAAWYALPSPFTDEEREVFGITWAKAENWSALREHRAGNKESVQHLRHLKRFGLLRPWK